MGAQDFRFVHTTKKQSAEDAFLEAVEAARYEHGNDPYNGTISTTDFMGDVTKALPRYGTKAFKKDLDALFLQGTVNGISLNKYQCVAVEIKGKALKELKGRRHGTGSKKRFKAWVFIGIAAC